MINLHLDTVTENGIKQFDTQLEMLNWLVDNDFKTKEKTETGVIYYRVADQGVAVRMFDEDGKIIQ